MLMGYAFAATGDHLFIVPRGFAPFKDTKVITTKTTMWKWGTTKVTGLPRLTTSRIKVPDPGDRATAQLTNEADRPVVAALTETARRSEAFTCSHFCLRLACPDTSSCVGVTEWFIGNVCCCCGFCGCAYLIPICKFSRDVRPGKSSLKMIRPIGAGEAEKSSADAPVPAEMTREPAGGDKSRLVGSIGVRSDAVELTGS